MLSLVLVVLGLGFHEAVLGLASSLLENSEFFIELGHLRLSLVHEVVVLLDLLLQRLENNLLDAGAVEAINVAGDS